MSEKSGGGFHFGNVGGSVSQSAGGDIVGRDKITTTIQGFASEEKKQQFHTEIEELREGLRSMKTEIEQSAALDRDKKDEIVSEILEQVKALKEVKENTEQVTPGKPPPSKVADQVEAALDRTSGIMDKLKDVATKTGDVAETVGKFAKVGDIAEAVGKFAAKYGPLILSARSLFGIP